MVHDTKGMCGTAGYIGRFPLNREQVTYCQEQMRRRGPDSNGFCEKMLSDGTYV